MPCSRSAGSPYQNDHEDANGQFEMNWDYDDALVTADRHAFFKFMAKSIAEKHGLRATFMPKPFLEPDRQRLPRPYLAVGSRRQDQHVRDATGEIGLSQQGYQLHRRHHAFTPRRWPRITNPTVNSYKRINAPRTHLGRHLVAQHGHLDRQQPHPHDPRARAGPLRIASADGAANPYLLQAGHSRRRSRWHRQQGAIRASVSTSTCIPTAIR